ncbi:cytochrome P450 [Streptomyces violaceusniger]|nr:cytochrome P450 [Streptomyces sp. 11-1-2]
MTTAAASAMASPRVRTAREGVAWTFGVDADTYRPERET